MDWEPLDKPEYSCHNQQEYHKDYSGYSQPNKDERQYALTLALTILPAHGLPPLYLKALLEIEPHIASADACGSTKDDCVRLLRVSLDNPSICTDGIHCVPVAASNQHGVWFCVCHIIYFL